MEHAGARRARRDRRGWDRYISGCDGAWTRRAEWKGGGRGRPWENYTVRLRGPGKASVLVLMRRVPGEPASFDVLVRACSDARVRAPAPRRPKGRRAESDLRSSRRRPRRALVGWAPPEKVPEEPHVRLLDSVSRMSFTPSGSSTTFVPSHRAFFVNSEQSSLISTFLN